MSWSRLGDFFIAKTGLHAWQNKDRAIFPVYDEREVCFRNELPSTTLNQIIVKHEYDEKNHTTGYLTITLYPSVFTIEKLKLVFSKLFPDVEMDNDYITMKFTRENLNRLNTLFDSLNQEFNRTEFDANIKKELENLLHFKSNTLLHYHIINVRSRTVINTSNALINPDEKTSVDLNSLLCTLYFNKQDMLKNLKKLLVKGADATQPRVFINVLLMHDIEVFKFIIRYVDLNFMRRRQDLCFRAIYESPIEVAKRFDKVEQFDMMTVTKIPRNNISSIPPRKKLLISHCKMALGDQELVTRFEFNNNKTILTHLIPMNELLQNGRNKQVFFEVLNLFKDTFEDPAGSSKKVIETFVADFSAGKTKWVEIITEKDNKEKKIIGCNLFEILNLKNNKDHLVFSPIYAFIKPEYRGYKIMSLLAFRLPFVLQRMMPNKKVAIYYSAMSSSSSIEMARDFAHCPLLQPDHVVKLLNEIFSVYYGDNFKYHHDGGMTFYFKEPNMLKVKTHGAETKEDAFIQQEVFGSQAHVATPVFFYVADDSSQKLGAKLKEIGIDFESHIQNMLPELTKFMPEFNSHQVCKYLPHGQSLFWNNELKPSKPVQPPCELRSKL